MSAQKKNVDISSLISCVLPYGTGNDFALTTNWGGDTSSKIYRNVEALCKELCLNTQVKDVNVWNVKVNFRDGGDLYAVDSYSRDLEPQNLEVYERDMINYFGLGEDGRIGVAFE